MHNGVNKKKINRGNKKSLSITNKRNFLIDCFINKDSKNLKEGLLYANLLANSMNSIPTYCFKLIREYSGYTIEELYENSGISEATIKRYFYEENKKRYNKITLIKFLLFTNCPYKASLKLLEVCRCKLNNSNPADIFYDHMLADRWYYKMSENMKYIKEKV